MTIKECRLPLLKETSDEKKKNQIFDEYEEKQFAYIEMAEALMKKYEDIGTGGGTTLKGKGFPVSDTKKQSGLMTICSGLSTLLSMDLDLVADLTEIESGAGVDVNKLCLKSEKHREEILKMVQYITDYVDAGNGVYVYDASPYVVQKGKPRLDSGKEGDFGGNRSYLGGICWVMTSMLKVYSLSTMYVEEKPLFVLKKDLLEKVKAVISDCLKKIVNYAILDKENKAKGWSYSGPPSPDSEDKRERSLFFTYLVAETWLNIYDCFGKEYYFFKNDLKETFNDKEEALKFIISSSDGKNKEGLLEECKRLSGDRISFMVELNSFKSITDSQHAEAYFARLKSYTVDVARDIWNKHRETIADSLFFYDEKQTPSFDNVLRSGRSDVLFNTLFMQGIMLSSALDLDIKERNETKGKEKSEEYKSFCGNMENALQNTIEKYMGLMRTNDTYKVEKYIVTLPSENSEEDLVKKIRNSDMVGFSLVPLMVRINSLISEFVIEYPQRQMKDHINFILTSSCLEGEKPQWIWERDGYSTESNYRFVNAIIDFYRYYEKYERPALRDAKWQDEIGKLYKEKNGKLKKDNSLLENELKETKERINALEKRSKEEDSVTEVMNKLIQKSFEENFFKMIGGLYDSFYTRIRSEKDYEFENEDKLKKLLDILMLALVRHLYDDEKTGIQTKLAGSGTGKYSPLVAHKQMENELWNVLEEIFLEWKHGGKRREQK